MPYSSAPTAPMTAATATNRYQACCCKSPALRRRTGLDPRRRRCLARPPGRNPGRLHTPPGMHRRRRILAHTQTTKQLATPRPHSRRPAGICPLLTGAARTRTKHRYRSRNTIQHTQHPQHHPQRTKLTRIHAPTPHSHPARPKQQQASRQRAGRQTKQTKPRQPLPTETRLERTA